jgi:sterol 3beta-glucosyltransferase
MTRPHKITILAIGSTGDLYPFCALALGLQQAGHQVRLATNSNFEAFVRGLGLEFAAIAGDFQTLLKSELGQKLLQGERVKLIEDDLLRQQMHDALNAAQDAEVFIFNQLTIWGYHVAEKLNIPCFLASSIPFSATRSFPFLSFSEDPNTNLFKGWLNYGSYLLIELVSTWQSRTLINNVRQEWGLPSLPALGARFRRAKPRYLSSLPILYGVSPSIFSQPKDWKDSIYITGAWFLDCAEEYEPPAALTQFLEAGEAPICVGFGSMTDSSPELTNIVLEAIAGSKQRAIILSGWGGLGKIEPAHLLKQQVFVIDSVPHSWLFSRVKAVVHHGGAGTTAAVCRAGLPSVVVPYFADQKGWGERLYQLGVSPNPIPRKQLTVASLAEAIAIVTSDRAMQQKSAQLGLSIRSENGVEQAVATIEQYLTESLKS